MTSSYLSCPTNIFFFQVDLCITVQYCCYRFVLRYVSGFGCVPSQAVTFVATRSSWTHVFRGNRCWTSAERWQCGPKQHTLTLNNLSIAWLWFAIRNGGERDYLFVFKTTRNSQWPCPPLVWPSLIIPPTQIWVGRILWNVRLQDCPPLGLGVSIYWIKC